MRLRSWLFGHWEDVSRQCGFEQVDFPVVENEELFIRKAGEEITSQLYNFEVGLVCLVRGMSFGSSGAFWNISLI